MTQNAKKPAEATAIIVDLLTPFTSDDRQRVVRAALTLLGEANLTSPNVAQTSSASSGGSEESTNSFIPAAKMWMKQNSISEEDLYQVFHVEEGKIDVIAADAPGSTKSKKTLNAYIVAALAEFLESGANKVDDKKARDLCVKLGCYDGPNHASIMKGMGNELSGSKEKGWTLTAPGKKKAAELVKEIAKAG